MQHDMFNLVIMIIVLLLILILLIVSTGFLVDHLNKDKYLDRIRKKGKFPSKTHSQVGEYLYFKYWFWQRNKKKCYRTYLEEIIEAQDIYTFVYSRRATTLKVINGDFVRSKNIFRREVYCRIN